VDFSLTTEQQLLKDSVERFVEEDYDFRTRREIAASDEGFRRENWARFAELGWLGAALPESCGGSGGGPVETMVIMEAFGRGLVTEPYLSSVVLGGGLVARHGSAAQREAVLPALVEGETMLAFAYAEPRSRYDLAHVATRAAREDGGYRLDGRKAVVFGAASADRIVVSARTAGGERDGAGITLFLVDATAPGLARRDYRTVDGLRASEVMLDGVRVAADAVLGEPDGALPVIEEAIDHGIAAVAAEAVGAMQVLNDTTNEYLKTRRQFGRPIGDFQVLKHRMVDMLTRYEEARSMCCMVTLKLGETPAERAKAASAAKVQIGRSGRFIGQQAVQLHGGIGITDELHVGHYFKRLTMIDTLFGNVDHHLRRFASLAC